MAKTTGSEFIKASVRFTLKNYMKDHRLLGETYTFNPHGASEPAQWIVGMVLTTLQFYSDAGVLSVEQVNAELGKVRERLTGIMFLENKATENNPPA